MAATAAFAFKTGGEFAGDKFSGTGIQRFSPNLAPASGSVIALGTKTATTVDVSTLAGYKFFFSKVSDNTSVVGKLWFGTAATWKDASAVMTSGEGPWHPGKGLKTITFAPISSATPVQVTIYKQ